MNINKMKILQINKFYWNKGGSEAAYFALSSLLKKHGHVVIPFSMKDERNQYSDYEQYFVNNISYDCGSITNKLSAAMRIIYSFDAKSKMRALLIKEHPQLAHFHIFQHQISVSAFSPLIKENIPIILTLHDLKPLCPNYKMLTHDGICERCKGNRFYNCLLHSCTKGTRLGSLINTIEMYIHYAMGYYQNVDHYIAVSKFYREKMIEFGFSQEKVSYIPNSIDVTRYSIGSDNDYGLYFGRLSEEKGLETLLLALKSVPDIHFKIVGTGPLESKLKSMQEDAQLKNVIFLGFKSGEELQKLIEEASFTVVPSTWYENCPMTILESFAACKPVIGARIGGIPELIDEGVDGFTFMSGNSEELAMRMKDLWQNKLLRTEMGRKGRNKVERDFSPELQYKRTISLYDSVLNNRSK